MPWIRSRLRAGRVRKRKGGMTNMKQHCDDEIVLYLSCTHNSTLVETLYCSFVKIITLKEIDKSLQIALYYFL